MNKYPNSDINCWACAMNPYCYLCEKPMQWVSQRRMECMTDACRATGEYAYAEIALQMQMGALFNGAEIFKKDIK